MTSVAEHLPHVDEHTVVVAAGVDVTWEALLRVVEGPDASEGAVRMARLLGCADTAPSGDRPLREGASTPGFHVAVAEPETELALLGSHRFSDYALIFRLERDGDGSTSVRAETRARFPGLRGTVYRTLVIGTRMHVLATRRILAAVKRSAERRAGAISRGSEETIPPPTPEPRR